MIAQASHIHVSQPLMACTSEDGNLTVSRWGKLLVARWSGPVTLDNVRFYNRAFAVACVMARTRISTLHLLDPGLPMPGPAERQAVLEFFNIQRERLAGVAVVPGGYEFWTGTASSWLLALRLLAAQALRLQAFRSPQHALRWLSTAHHEAAGESLDAEGVARWLDVEAAQRPVPRRDSSVARPG